MPYPFYILMSLICQYLFKIFVAMFKRDVGLYFSCFFNDFVSFWYAYLNIYPKGKLKSVSLWDHSSINQI